MKPKSATYLRYIYACFRQRQADKAYEMLLTMESEWRVPEPKDYQRMWAPPTLPPCVDPLLLSAAACR